MVASRSSRRARPPVLALRERRHRAHERIARPAWPRPRRVVAAACRQAPAPRQAAAGSPAPRASPPGLPRWLWSPAMPVSSPIWSRSCLARSVLQELPRAPRRTRRCLRAAAAEPGLGGNVYQSHRSGGSVALASEEAREQVVDLYRVAVVVLVAQFDGSGSLPSPAPGPVTLAAFPSGPDVAVPAVAGHRARRHPRPTRSPCRWGRRPWSRRPGCRTCAARGTAESLGHAAEPVAVVAVAARGREHLVLARARPGSRCPRG